MMKTIAFAAAVALAAPAAHAQGQISIGYTAQTAEEAQMIQGGLLLYRLAQGVESGAFVHQNGTLNGAALQQLGHGSVGVIHQEGNGHTGTLVQQGHHQGHGLFQFGNGSTQHVVQTVNGQTGVTFVIGLD